MKKHYFLFALLVITGWGSNAQTFEWVQQIGEINSEGQRIYSKIDASGNIYSVGAFVGSMDFNTGTEDYILSSTGGSIDIFILKQDPNGNFVWAKTIGGSGYEVATALELDTGGNLYFTGQFNSPEIDFDPGTGFFNLNTFGELDPFVLKLSPNGDFIWVKQIGGINSEFSNAISVDNFKNVYIIGRYYGVTDFDPSNVFYEQNPVGSNDIYILKLNSEGLFVWVKSIGGYFDDVGLSIAVDHLGNIYTTGIFSDICDFDPDQGINNLSTVSNNNPYIGDVFISKLDSNGLFVWARSLGSTNEDIGAKIVINTNGNIVVAGTFSGQTDFDPGIEQYIGTVVGLSDVFVLNLDSEGNYLWSSTIGYICDDFGSDLENDKNGNLYVTGSLCNVNSSDYDVLTIKLDALGNFKWTGIMGSYSTDRGFSIDIDSAGNIYTSGGFQGSVDFDPGEGVSNLTAISNYDFFIQKLNPDNVSTQAPSTLPSISLYPNPSNGIYTLKSETQSAFSVIDLLGKTIITGSNNHDEPTEIDISGFGNGLYFLRVGNQVIKLMKQE